MVHHYFHYSLAKVKGSLAGHRWSRCRDTQSAPGSSEPMPLACELKLGGISKVVFCFLFFVANRTFDGMHLVISSGLAWRDGTVCMLGVWLRMCWLNRLFWLKMI